MVNNTFNRKIVRLKNRKVFLKEMCGPKIRSIVVKHLLNTGAQSKTYTLI